jgi:hypothetical protein
MVRTLYDAGEIEVASSDYVHSVAVDDGDDFEDEAIPGLDDIATRTKRLRFTLDYPFERGRECEVASPTGITLRQIIDAVRSSFREMYTGTRSEPIPGLPGNLRVEGPYGTALHGIDDLVIEVIDLDEDRGLLDISIGS